MLGYSGLVSRLRNLPTRSIDKKVTRARNIAQLKKRAENPVPVEVEAAPKAAPKRVIELKYPLQTLPKSTKASGWLEPLGGTEHLPFQFARTPTKQLPVYSDLRHGYTKRVTVLRKFTGDTGEIKAELRRLLGETAQVKQYEGRLEVTGHHVIKLKRWLRRLGF